MWIRLLCVSQTARSQAVHKVKFKKCFLHKSKLTKNDSVMTLKRKLSKSFRFNVVI